MCCELIDHEYEYMVAYMEELERNMLAFMAEQSAIAF